MALRKAGTMAERQERTGIACVLVTSKEGICLSGLMVILQKCYVMHSLFVFLGFFCYG